MGITLVCPICGKSFIKKMGEYNRQLKKRPNHTFYCSPNCASVGVSEKERFLPFEKKCLYCKKSFITYPGIRERFYCSRSCASAGSVNENRRNAGKYAASVNFTPETHTTEVVAKRLYQREKYRYVELEKYLTEHNISYQFEYPINHYIYDLALLNHKLIIEFDEKYHRYVDENEKYKCANVNGWQLIHVKALEHEVFSPNLIIPFL